MSEELKTKSALEEPLTENQVEINPKPTLINLCQGYLVDPETKLHLCNACEYHKHRNQTKPWLKVV